MGPSARENYDATIRIVRCGRQQVHRSLQRLPVPGVCQPGAGFCDSRYLFACQRSTISSHRAAIQVLICQFLEHNVRMVSIRSIEIRQFSHTSAGQIVQSYSSDADGQNRFALKIRILRVLDGNTNFMRHAFFPIGQRIGRTGTCILVNHIDDGTVAAGPLPNV